MNHLRVKNWEEFQQYKDDRPLHWVKLHISLLDDYEFDALSEAAQLHLVKIWMLAGKLNNRIPNDAAWIGRKIGAQSAVPLQEIVSAGFLIPYETVRSNSTKPYGESDRDVPREEKSREEKHAAAAPPNFWDVGKGLGISGSVIGKLIRDHGEARTAEWIAAAAVKRPADPTQWLMACAQERPKNEIPKDPKDVEAWARSHGYPTPKPGESMWDYKQRISA